MSTHHLEGPEQLISIDELSEYLGVPVKTIYDWRLTGHGPCAIRVGRHPKVPCRRCPPSGTFVPVSGQFLVAADIRARTRFRDADGRLREVKATACTRNRAIADLKEDGRTPRRLGDHPQ